MPTFHIHIQGQVQGVGFRPHVFRLAFERKLRGWVCNDLDGVHIKLNAAKTELESFLEELIAHPPVQAKISETRYWEVEEELFQDFTIAELDSQGSPTVFITPDVALCEACRAEMSLAENRRHSYAFITCTNCGPRYSILNSLPFERANTTMKSFLPCPECVEEYRNPSDNRFHSQTNSCSTCGIQLTLQGYSVSNEEKRKLIHDAWKRGETVAVKGIGGYLLTCDASNESAVQALRRRKNRPAKPLALMYPTIEMVERDLHIHSTEKNLLQGPVAPILVLPCRKNTQENIALAAIAPGMNTVGAMLPYAPLFEWLLEGWNHPIVATSGNRSGDGIIYDDQEAAELLPEFASLILSHNRTIAFQQDDSVMVCGEHPETRIILRRARGLAPNSLLVKNIVAKAPTLALGADLKATFSINPGDRIVTSQYLGNLEGYETLRSFREVLDNLLEIHQFHPTKILVDEHPGYFSGGIGQELAEQFGAKLERIQHHEAHFAAVLAEHDLVHTKREIMGFIWDGTGYGSDGTLWGGESFSYQAYQMQRSFFLQPFPVLLGDKMAREPRISGLVLASMSQEDPSSIRQAFTETEWKLYSKMARSGSGTTTSSMGRLFDGVASLIGLIHRNSFEGEAAIRLEQCARGYSVTHGLSLLPAYPFSISGKWIQWQEIIRGILADLLSQKDPAEIAFRFHCTLVEVIRQIGRAAGTTDWAFSGGVFQNSLLVDLIHSHLSIEASLFFHQELSPNDENISAGQLVRAHIQDYSYSEHLQSTTYVSGNSWKN